MGSVGAHGQRQRCGACGAREGLLPATTMPWLPALELLWDALLLVSDALTAGLGLLALPWETPLWAALLVVTLKSRRPSGRGTEPADRASARAEVDGKVRGQTGRMAQEDEAPRTPALEASAPTRQSLCLAALDQIPSGASPDVEGLFAKAPKSRPSPLCCPGRLWARLQRQIRSLGVASEACQRRGAEARKTLTTAHEKVHRLQEKLRAGLKENAHLQHHLEGLCHETEGWRLRTRVLRAQKEGLDRAHARRRRVLEERGRQPTALVAATLKTFPGPAPGEAEGTRGADDAEHPPARLSDAGPKRPLDAGRGSVSLQRHQEDSRELSRQLSAAHHVNGELAGQVQRLQTQRASLQAETTRLEREVRELRLRLGMLPQLHEAHVRLLLRTAREEEARHLDTQKKYPRALRRLDSLGRQGRVYKKMAEDMGRELASTVVSSQNAILFYEARARERGMAARCAERQLLELRRGNAAVRQRLARLPFQLQPFPGRPLAPAAPHGAEPGPHGPGDALAHRAPQEAGRSGWEGPGFQSPTRV